jgi:hypothetical protein
LQYKWRFLFPLEGRLFSRKQCEQLIHARPEIGLVEKAFNPISRNPSETESVVTISEISQMAKIDGNTKPQWGNAIGAPTGCLVLPSAFHQRALAVQDLNR